MQLGEVRLLFVLSVCLSAVGILFSSWVSSYLLLFFFFFFFFCFVLSFLLLFSFFLVSFCRFFCFCLCVHTLCM